MGCGFAKRGFGVIEGPLTAKLLSAPLGFRRKLCSRSFERECATPADTGAGQQCEQNQKNDCLVSQFVDVHSSVRSVTWRGGLIRLWFQTDFRGYGAQRGDDKVDVFAEIYLQLLGAFIYLIAIYRARKRFVFQFLLH